MKYIDHIAYPITLAFVALRAGDVGTILVGRGPHHQQNVFASTRLARVAS